MAITLNHNRTIALGALLEAYKERFSLSIEELDKSLQGWNVVALFDNEFPIGAVAVLDGFGHIGIKKEYRGKWGGRKTLSRLCDIFSVNKTIVCHENTKSMHWLCKSGWVRVGENEKGVIYARK